MATRVVSSIAIPRRRVERYELRNWVLVVVGFMLLAGLSLTYLTQINAVATLGYDVKNLENEQKTVQAKNEQLRLQIAQLKSLNRIEKEASIKLGMIAPKEVVWVAPTATPNQATSQPTTVASRDNIRAANTIGSSTKASAKAEANLLDGLLSWLPFGQKPL